MTPLPLPCPTWCRRDHDAAAARQLTLHRAASAAEIAKLDQDIAASRHSHESENLVGADVGSAVVSADAAGTTPAIYVDLPADGEICSPRDVRRLARALLAAADVLDGI